LEKIFSSQKLKKRILKIFQGKNSKIRTIPNPVKNFFEFMIFFCEKIQKKNFLLFLFSGQKLSDAKFFFQISLKKKIKL